MVCRITFKENGFDAVKDTLGWKSVIIISVIHKYRAALLPCYL